MVREPDVLAELSADMSRRSSTARARWKDCADDVAVGLRHATCRAVTRTLLAPARVSAITLLLCAAPSLGAAQEVRPLERVPPRPPTSEPQGFLREPDLVTRLSIFFDRKLGNGELIEGWYYGMGDLVPGAGFPSVGVGYRKWYADGRALADGSASISWRGYKSAQARLEFPALASSRFLAGAQVRLQDFPDITYYGEGAGTSASDRSEYDLRSANIVGYATFRPVRWLGISGDVGWLNPSIESRSEPSFTHAGASIVADTRDFAGHPTSGGVYRVAAADFSDRDTGTFSFKRYEAEAAQFLPVAGSRVVLALRGWLVASDAGDAVPFYLQPSLGGHNSLRGYPEYRFHDRNMLVVNVETRIAMMTHVDAALFMDAGSVAARVGDLDLAKRSYGAGLRLHSRRQTFLRVDAARSDEGWRFVLRLDDPLNLARLARRTAAAPFVH